MSKIALMPAVMLPWAQAIWQQPALARAAWTVHTLPPPALTDSDRLVQDDASLLSLAVALDVLATGLRGLPADAALLSQVVEVSRRAAHMGEEDLPSVQPLLDLAADAIGSERARVGQALARLTAGAGVAAGNLSSAGESTPADVAAALHGLSHATRLVIEESVLLLTARWRRGHHAV